MTYFKKGSLLLLIVLFLFIPYFNGRTAAHAATVGSTTVEVIGQNGTQLQAPTSVSLTPDSTALSALKTAVGTGTDQVKLTNGMITTIKGLTSPSDWSAFWSFYVNGVGASVGADQYKPKDQDVLLFEYHPGTGLLDDEVSVAVNSDYGTDVKLGQGLTVLSALQKLEGKDQVTVQNNQLITIGGTKADATHTWQVQLNGKTQAVTDLSTPLKAQDELSLKLVAKPQPATPAQTVSTTQLQQAINLATSYVNQNGVDDWDAIALAKAGKTVPTSYLTNLEQTVKEAKGQFHAVTDTEKYTLSMLAAGGDPTNASGYDLVKSIYDGNVTQTLNGVVFGLIALDSASFQIPNNASWTPTKMVDYLLNHQNKDGGWAWDGSTKSDLDTTGMVLTALAKHTHSDQVNTAIQKAVAYLSNQYQLGKVDNSSTAATMVIGLTANSVDPEGSSFTLKDGTTLMSFLLSFQGKDGGFVWQTGNSVKEDSFSTDQAFRGLVAEQLYQAKKGALYTFDWKKAPVQSEQTSSNKESSPSTNTSSASGSTLPNTATPYYNIIMLGVLLLILAGVNLKKKRA